MAEDLELLAQLCRGVAESQSGCLVGDEARELDREFLIYLQRTNVQHPFLTGKTMGSSQEEPLRRRMIDCLSAVL